MGMLSGLSEVEFLYLSNVCNESAYLRGLWSGFGETVRTELLAPCLHILYVPKAVAVIAVIVVTITITTMTGAPLRPGHSNRERDSGAGYSTETGNQWHVADQPLC